MIKTVWIVFMIIMCTKHFIYTKKRFTEFNKSKILFKDCESRFDSLHSHNFLKGLFAIDVFLY